MLCNSCIYMHGCGLGVAAYRTCISHSLCCSRCRRMHPSPGQLLQSLQSLQQKLRTAPAGQPTSAASQHTSNYSWSPDRSPDEIPDEVSTRLYCLCLPSSPCMHTGLLQPVSHANMGVMCQHASTAGANGIHACNGCSSSGSSITSQHPGLSSSPCRSGSSFGPPPGFTNGSAACCSNGRLAGSNQQRLQQQQQHYQQQQHSQPPQQQQRWGELRMPLQLSHPPADTAVFAPLMAALQELQVRPGHQLRGSRHDGTVWHNHTTCTTAVVEVSASAASDTRAAALVILPCSHYDLVQEDTRPILSSSLTPS